MTGVQTCALPISFFNTSEDTVYTCTISINCSNILSNWDIFDKTKASCVPSDGWILREMTVEFKKGQTVFDVLKNVTRKEPFRWNIHLRHCMEAII